MWHGKIDESEKWSKSLEKRMNIAIFLTNISNAIESLAMEDIFICKRIVFWPKRKVQREGTDATGKCCMKCDIWNWIEIKPNDGWFVILDGKD